ncbi:MAG: SiaB family protein kinase [Flavobacteriales bacterium]|nr:SiaB family protein kinase [Flavobacteriales bacterium]
MEEFDNHSLFNLHRSIIKEHMEFLYKGNITVDVVNILLQIVKNKFNEFKIDYSLQKRIYNIAVECLENVSDHGVSGSDIDSIFLIGKVDGVFIIGTGNIINNNVTNSLGSSLNKINTLDREGLKLIYKEKMTEQLGSDSNDAGLGLIDIALKANNKLDYQINPVNAGQDFFSFQVKINL